jgi:HEAT repeat protein
MDDLNALIRDIQTKEGKEKERAVKSLGKIREPKATELLIDLLSDGSARIRRFAAAALGERKDPRAVVPLVSAFEVDDPHLRSHAKNALLAIGTPAVDHLISTLRSSSPSLRKVAAELLGIIKDGKAVNPLIHTLGDEDREVRMEAIGAVSSLKDVRAVEGLIGALQDGDSHVRRLAAIALGEIRDSRAVRPLIATLGDLDVVGEATEALGKIKNPSAVTPLIAVLQDKDLRIGRAIAAEALGEIADDRALGALIAALNDDENYVRESAADALAKIGASAISPLIKTLKEENPFVRHSATFALVKIGNASIGPLLENLTDWYCSEAVADALCRLDWKPESREARVHLLVAQRRGYELKQDWAATKEVLLNDVEGKRPVANKNRLLAFLGFGGSEDEGKTYRLIENALFAFVGLGNEEMIPLLMDKLNVKGSKTMAEAYLNCGHPELMNAARDWAQRHGYVIRVGQGAQPVSWGAWR